MYFNIKAGCTIKWCPVMPNDLTKGASLVKTSFKKQWNAKAG
jgi:hypothetical protein